MATAPEPTPVEQSRGAPARREPTAEEPARRAAALGRLRTYGDPVLRTRARAVPAVDAAVTAQIRAMTQLLDDALEAGLAAPQLGILNRVFVYRLEGDDGRLGPVRALVNPELEWAGDETSVVEEGCLSIPGVWIPVERPTAVRVRAVDAAGAPVVIEADEPESRVLQHELDHLDGILTLDRTSKADRRAALRQLRAR